VLTLDDGFATRYYVDPASFLITRSRVRKALHPDADPTPTTIETVWSDFRQVAGVRFAFAARDTDLATGTLLQTTTLLCGRTYRSTIACSRFLDAGLRIRHRSVGDLPERSTP
jgi:hypothetical protein